MTTKVLNGKAKLSDVSMGRLMQLGLAMNQDSGLIVDMAISEFWVKNRSVVEDYRRKLDEGTAFEVSVQSPESGILQEGCSVG